MKVNIYLGVYGPESLGDWSVGLVVTRSGSEDVILKKKIGEHTPMTERRAWAEVVLRSVATAVTAGAYDKHAAEIVIHVRDEVLARAVNTGMGLEAYAETIGKIRSLMSLAQVRVECSDDPLMATAYELARSVQ